MWLSAVYGDMTAAAAWFHAMHPPPLDLDIPSAVQAIASAVATFEQCQAEAIIEVVAGNDSAFCNVAAGTLDISTSMDALAEVIEETIAISGCNGTAQTITNETDVVRTPVDTPDISLYTTCRRGDGARAHAFKGALGGFHACEAVTAPTQCAWTQPKHRSLQRLHSEVAATAAHLCQ